LFRVRRILLLTPAFFKARGEKKTLEVSGKPSEENDGEVTKPLKKK